MMSKLFSVLLSFVLLMLYSRDVQAKDRCKLGTARIVDWTKLSGIWYNTFSHEADSLRLVGRCNSMVVAGTFGFDGVAVVKNVLSDRFHFSRVSSAPNWYIDDCGNADSLPQISRGFYFLEASRLRSSATAPKIFSRDFPNDSSEFPIKSVSEFFNAIDPGIYKLDKSSEYHWIQTPLLEKIMDPRNVTDFVNAIAQHYSTPFAVTTSDYDSFFVVRQCGWNDDSSIWVYTRTPDPGQQVVDRINRHLRYRGISTNELTKNNACEDALNSIYKKANGHKKTGGD